MTKESSFKKIFSGKGRRSMNLFLLCFVILLFFVNAYNLALKNRPAIIHQWRQSDCLSFTKNYYEEGMDFFHPKIHFQANNDGSVVSEFPILNYTVACLWKIFGEHEFIYKILEYCIFILSIFFLFNSLLRSNASFLFSFFCVSIFLTSPMLVYYGFNFIADVPALSLAIIGFCLLYSFYDTRSLKYFYWCLFVSTLAVLIKASAIMPLALLLFFSIIDVFNLNRIFKTEKLFAKKTLPVSFILLSVLLIVSWYKYAVYYNGDNSSNGVFLLTVLPIWEMPEEAILSNFQSLFNILFPVFLNKPMFFLFLSTVIFVYANLKKLNSFLKYSFVFATLFFVFYILFFFQVFTVHDYYLNNLMILPAITCLCVAHIVFNNEFKVINNPKFFTAFVIIVVVFNSFYSAAFFRLRTIKNDSMCSWYPFLSKEEKEYAAFLRWSYGNSTKPLETITPDLRKAGITRNDRVLSIPDESFNITLYLMDQKGLTLAAHRFTDSTLVKSVIAKNINYVVVNNPTIKNEASFKVITDNFSFLLKKEHVEVYKRKELQ